MTVADVTAPGEEAAEATQGMTTLTGTATTTPMAMVAVLATIITIPMMAPGLGGKGRSKQLLRSGERSKPGILFPQPEGCLHGTEMSPLLCDVQRSGCAC